MNKSLLLVGAAREGSVRVPNKMIRQFGDSSLFEIYLNKFEEIANMNHPFSDIILAVNRKDEILWKMSKKAKKVKIIERDDESVSQKFSGIAKTQSYLKDFDDDYILNVNACFPFLKSKTVINVANFFFDNPHIKSLTCARERHNHFWEVDTHRPLVNRDPACLNTRLLPPILENVNHILIYNRSHMLENDCYWDYTQDNPYIYIVVDNEECLDIDTQLEFNICKALYKVRNE